MSGDMYEVTMPKLGETVTEGLLSRWLKHVGDTVEFDDPLFEVSTDKVDSEVPSPYDGVMLEILVNEGDTVPVRTAVARIGEPGASAARGARPRAPRRPRGGAGARGPGAPATPAMAAPAAGVSETNEPATGPAAPAPSTGNGQPGVLLSPVVRRLAAEHGIDLAT